MHGEHAVFERGAYPGGIGVIWQREAAPERAKGALNAMTIALARALAPAIRVNAICPGMIETRWHKDRFDAEGYEKFKAEYEKMVPLAKAASPDDIADAALWLIEGAATLTGELMQLDSGLHLGFGRR